MRIAICDDEPFCLDKIQTIAAEYTQRRKNQNIVLDTFLHPDDLLEAAEKIGGYEIYILDVIMPNIDGIELGTRLRNAGYTGKIIYLTSSKEFSLDAFRVRAFDYLIKPVDRDAFFKTVDEAIAGISETKPKAMLVKTREKTVKLSFDSIMYVQNENRAVCYYLADGRALESTTLRTTFAEAVAELLEDRRFYLCGQSMAVNLDHIMEMESDAVVFKNGCQAMSERNCRKLRGVWSDYLFNGDG